MTPSGSHAVIATVNQGGRLRLPQKVIDQLRVSDGQQIVFFLRTGRVALVAPVDSAVVQPPSFD